MIDCIYKFDTAIYPINLYVVLSNDSKFIEDSFERLDGSKISWGDEYSKNRATTSVVLVNKKEDKIGIFIQCPTRKIDVVVLSHESYHFARQLFEYIGEDAPSNESFAYLVGWCAGCISKALRNKVKPI